MYKPIFKRSEYVPRHARFEALETKTAENFREITEDIPLLSDSGEVVATSQRVVKVPSKDIIGKYKESDFKISNLVAAGVPLSQVSLVTPTESAQDFIDFVAGRVDDISHLMVSSSHRQTQTQTEPVPNPSNSVPQSIENNEPKN